jgi:uncharacterized protein (DUF58 family)
MSGRTAGVVALGGATVAVGVLLGWLEVEAVGIGLLALLAVPALLRRPSAATWSDVSVPRRVIRGDDAAVVVAVSVPRGSTAWVSAVDDAGTDRTWLPDGVRHGELRWPIDTSHRGLFPGGPSRLETADPFGLSRRVLARREPSPVLVVPRVHGLDATGAWLRGDDGDAAEREGSDQFHSLREYVVGDPMKMIHWPSSAHAGKLMVRRMVDTTIPWLLLVLDVNDRAYDRAAALFADFDATAFEESVDTCASWAWWSCGPKQRVLLTTTALSGPSAEVTSGTRESALDMLALVQPSPAPECGPGRVAAMARRQGVGQLVLVTGRRTETSAAWVANWRRTVPVSVVVGHA